MFHRIRENLKLSGNKKNVAKLSIGTILGQGSYFVTLPIITRIYGVEIIGTWALLISIATVIQAFSDFGLTNAIMVDEEGNLEESYRVITTIIFVVSALGSFVVLISFKLFGSKIGFGDSIFIAILFVSVFTLQQTQVCYTWLNRKAQYDVLMKNPLIHGCVYGAIAIGLGMLGFTSYGYYIGQVVGRIITLLHMKRYLSRRMFTFNKEEFIRVFQKNKRFIIYQLPVNVIGSFKGQLPVLLIKGLWGTEILGYYAITIRLLQLPSSLLGAAIGRVFFRTTASMKRQGKALGEYVYNNLVRSMKISVVPMALIMAYGDIAAVILLGHEWKMAGDFVRILALQYYFNFIMITVQGLSITLDKQKYAMISIIAQIITSASALLVGKFAFGSVYYGLFFMAVSFVVINIVFFCIIFKVMNFSWRKYLRNVLVNAGLMLGLAGLLRYGCNVLGI